MILKASERGNVGELARHLLNDRDNEHVELHELRGFVSDTLSGAMKEIEAIARGTRCRNCLFSVSLNPPATETPPVEAFEDAAARIEKELGLEGQPRAIVFHEKEGRRHAHVVWSKIDGWDMKAINLSFYKNKLTAISKELYLEHGWRMPDGLRDERNRDPLTFTLEEYQQARRAGHDPKEVKALIRECWINSDDRTCFEAELRRKGFWLARGDRRGFVAIDRRGEVFSLNRMTGAKTKELSARLGEPEALPSAADVNAAIAAQLTGKLKAWAAEMEAQAQRAGLAAKFQREQMAQRHRDARAKLKAAQEARWLAEERARAARLPKGIGAVWGWITGRNRKIRAVNEAEIATAAARDRAERQTIITAQLEERRRFQHQVQRAKTRERDELQALNQEMSALLSQSPDALKDRRIKEERDLETKRPKKEVRSIRLPKPRGRNRPKDWDRSLDDPDVGPP